MSKMESGDRVRVVWKGKTIEGMVMPQTDNERIVLKLNSGYNVGMDRKNVEKIEIVGKERIIKPKEVSGRRKKAEIRILGCGGTIASKVEYKTGAVYPYMSAEELATAFPEIEEIATIDARSVFSVLSEDMHQEHWRIMADEIRKGIEDGVKGVVVLHGTDTMHYSCSAMAFAIQNLPVPVVFTGAQRSADRPSSDNKLNLLNAVFTAKQDLGEVVAVMHATSNDDFGFVHRGVKVRKMHTSRRDAFKSINIPPLAKVDYRTKKFEKIFEYRKRNSGGIKFDNRFSEEVGLIYFYPGMNPKIFDAFFDYRGLVIVGTGLGHVSTNPFGEKSVKPVVGKIRELVESDVVVAMASQCINGRINMNVYASGRILKEIGVIGHLADWTPECAFVKLSWVLGHERNAKKAKEEMMQNLVGEMTERSMYTGEEHERI
ncbi:MAG: Glu-tRNA(Gln) amidotransferase subunit GatD [Candidatus Anstonellales archaeon]